MDVKHKVLIFSEKSTPRLAYVLHYLFTHLCGVDYETTHEQSAFETASTAYKINYSEQPLSGCYQMTPSGFVFEKGIREFVPLFQSNDRNGSLFIPNKEGLVHTPADIFDCIFYCLSRYEEYKTEQHDRHGRYIFTNSWAHKAGVLQQAWLDRKVNAFFAQLEVELGFTHFQPAYSFIPSVDLDYGYRFKGKGVVRFFGGLARDFKRADMYLVMGRIKANLGLVQDPYDNYEEIFHFHKVNQLPLITFILNAKFGKFDKGLKQNGKSVATIAKLAHAHGLSVGVHPSYQSHESFENLKKEVRGLSKKTNLKIRKSRQHFLKFYLPKTFNQLVLLGIKHDYSMGYAQESGFRASTCRPFYLYDLNEEKQMPIQIHTTAIMEGTYFDYLRVSPESALEKMKHIVDEVKSVKGELITIWHEKQLASESPWKNVYYALAEYAMEKG